MKKNLFKKLSLILLVAAASIALVLCKPKTYEVTFDLQGGMGDVSSQKVKNKHAAERPIEPTWQGYDFGGWYQDISFEEDQMWVFSINVVTEDTTLYAKWIRQQDNGNNGNTTPGFVIPGLPDLTVRDAKGYNGMVATASGYASEVGVQILEAGGNAFDAAVAIGFALNVVEPNASGVGGGGFMVAYNGVTGKRLSYNYREFAPGLANREQYIGEGALELGDGPGSFGIPMFVDGMLTILEEQGTMSLAEVIQPAIDLAYHGFPITETLAEAIRDNFPKLMRPTAEEEALAVYTDGVSPLGEGELLINKNLANVLQIIASEGKEGFYKGDVARAIVNAVKVDGSVVTMKDLEDAIGRTLGAQSQTPLSGTYKDYELISMAPPSPGGTTLIEVFNILEHYDSKLVNGIKGLGHNTVDYIHAIGSATQLAFGDRRKFVGDPNFVDVPVTGLTSKLYAAERWSLFDPLVAKVFSGAGAEYGNPWIYEPSGSAFLYVPEEENQSASTTHFSVIDKFGNIVSATHTINYFFGNGYMPKGTGIHLNNIMSPFSINESSVNLIEPYKVPLSNMAPTIILKNDEPFMSIGSPGSMRIISAIVQTVLNVIEFDMDIQQAIASPRVHQYVRADMEIEGAMGDSTIEGLRAMGYTVIRYHNIDLYFGGVHGIIINQETKELHGGADPRRDGKAVGY